MFGKRPTSGNAAAVAERPAPAPAPAPPSAAPPAAPLGRRRRGRPHAVPVRGPRRAADPGDRRRRNRAGGPKSPRSRFLPPSIRAARRSYYEVKGTIFGALIEAIDLGAARQARRRFRARGNPRHRQRDHRDQEHRDVDLRAGGPARRHLQRRARLRAARAAAGARRHRRHHGQRLRHGLHRSRRQDSEDRHPLPRQPAAAQHLPAHRQPGRPPRR